MGGTEAEGKDVHSALVVVVRKASWWTRSLGLLCGLPLAGLECNTCLNLIQVKTARFRMGACLM